MTPKKITLEIVPSTGFMLKRSPETIRLRVDADQTQNGYVIIESAPYVRGASIPSMRKSADRYAKRFAIPFVDATVST